jgi:hypothetical protein
MLDSLITEHQEIDHQFTVYRSGDQPEVETWLANHGVAIDARPLPPRGPDPFVEIKTDGEVVAVIGVETIEKLLEPPVVGVGDRDNISEGYQVLFEALEKTVFSGIHRRDLLAVSREIEDRAFRVGEGTLWVCFQTLSTFRSQMDIYRTLATETALNIHIYGVEDWTPPSIPSVMYHAEAVEQFEPYWALAYDGGPAGTDACGLVAREDSDEYTGFWTNDSTIVEEIATTLQTS